MKMKYNGNVPNVNTMAYAIEQIHADKLMYNSANICEDIREQIDHELKQCMSKFPKYQNANETAQKIIGELYDDDVTSVLLLACTQMGKTSTVFWTAYNLMTHPAALYFVPYPFVFVITGLNSNSWKDQTQQRVLPCMARNVWHNKDVMRKENVKRLKEAVLSEYNALIVIDEVHVGTKLNNVIFNTLREFHPDHEDRKVSQKELFEFLHSKKVKFLLVSATPDAVKETMEQNWEEKRYRTVIAHPDSVPTYVWHKHFLEQGRVHQAYGMDERDENGRMFHRAIIRRISEYKESKYHMIRFPTDTKNANIENSINLLKKSIQKLNVKVQIVKWDSQNTIRDYFESRNYKVFADKSISKEKMERMTNEEILKEQPKNHIIFILKELFRVAQTMPIDHVGLLVDRSTKSPCDSTLSQSLIGRACGHNKLQFLDQIQIYTNKDSVVNYVNLWKNGFDYAKVPEYKGNGIKTTKNGTQLTSLATMMGDQVVRDAEWKQDVDDDNVNDDDQSDTPKRLQNVRRTYMKMNTIIHKMINIYKENGFEPLSETELTQASTTGSLCMKHYTTWNETHSRLKIIEKKNNKYELRNCIREYMDI